MGYRFSRTPIPVPQIKTAFREIRTSIPAPGTEAVLHDLEKYESRSMQGQMPIVWDRAEDFNIYDCQGNRWIDFTSTIFVANVGHANRRVVEAVKEMLAKPLLHNYAYANEKRAEYLKRLIGFAGSPFEKAFLLSAGTEATEAALKLMRMHGRKTGKRRLGILCLEGNWHGRTLGAQMMSGNPGQKEWIGTLDPDIHHIPFPYPWLPESKAGAAFFKKGLEALVDRGIDPAQDICGVMLETFQGWGAVFYPNDFVQAIEAYCRQNGILLTFDEMQSGFARTGRKFGFEHYGVTPDLICCGKGMGSGMPLSGVLGRADIMDLPAVGNMSSTHSANPLVCAAGLATLEEIEEKNLVSESARKGKLLLNGLNGLKERFPDHITASYGKGMVAAIHFKVPGPQETDAFIPSRVAERCMQKGLLVVHTGRESIKIGPPLTIPDAALLEGIEVIKEATTEVLKELR